VERQRLRLRDSRHAVGGASRSQWRARPACDGRKGGRSPLTLFTVMILSAVPACDSAAVRGGVYEDCGAALRRFEDASETNLPLVR
jgi:hypothetical protein